MILFYITHFLWLSILFFIFGIGYSVYELFKISRHIIILSPEGIQLVYTTNGSEYKTEKKVRWDEIENIATSSWNKGVVIVGVNNKKQHVSITLPTVGATVQDLEIRIEVWCKR